MITDEIFKNDTQNTLETLKTKIIGSTVKCTKYGEGTISDCSIDAYTNSINSDLIDVFVTIDFNGTSRKFSYSSSKSMFIKYPDNVVEAINEVIPSINIFTEELKERIKAANELAAKEYAKKQEDLKEAKRRKAIEDRIKENIESNINLTNKLSHSTFKSYNNFFVELGYIAKHVKNIDARMPDYVENWFIKEFGDAKHTAVDTANYRCPSGLPAQFALAIRIDLNSNENIPESLVKRFSKTEKVARSIADTEYAYNLCKNYGFKFGKEQNLDEIIANIPNSELDNFNLGYNLA